MAPNIRIREPETAGRLPVKTVAKQSPEPAPIEDSGSSVAAEGVVKRIGEKQAPATHALIVKVNDEEFVAAYLTAPELNLALWEKRRVRVNGTRYWVRGWRRPLITVEKIIPAWQR